MFKPIKLGGCMKKMVRVDESTHKSLMVLKYQLNLKSIDEVIKYLLTASKIEV